MNWLNVGVLQAGPAHWFYLLKKVSIAEGTLFDVSHHKAQADSCYLEKQVPVGEPCAVAQADEFKQFWELQGEQVSKDWR
eukprot:1159830-Pelagomonas_calceolata.AAC.7